MGIKGSSINKVYNTCKTDAEHILEDRGLPPMWPLNIVDGMWYLSKCYVKELYLTIKKLKNKGLSIEEIAKLFKAPSRISDLFHLDQFPMEGLTPEERLELINDLVNMLPYYRKEDIFCESGRNILLTHGEVEKLLTKHQFIKVADNGNQLRRIIGKINATTWLYTELITVAHHAYGHEFHGPYPLKNGKILIVREYYDLKVPEVWPFTKELPFEKIILFEVYKNVEIRFDAFNHMESSAPLPQNLQRVLVAIDNLTNNLKSVEEIEQLFATTKSLSNKAIDFTKDFTYKDWIKKLIEVHYYSLKPHKDVLSEDWRPSSEIYGFIENNNVDEEYHKFMRLVGSIYQRLMSSPPEEHEQIKEDGFKNLMKRFLTNLGVNYIL